MGQIVAFIVVQKLSLLHLRPHYSLQVLQLQIQLNT